MAWSSRAAHTVERLPFVHDQQPGDEVFGLRRRVGKLRLVKVPLAGQDVVQGLVVVVAEERTQTAQAGSVGVGGGDLRVGRVGGGVLDHHRSGTSGPRGCSACVCSPVYSQHISNDAEAPHVCVEGHKVVVDDLGSEELWGAEVHPQLLSGFVPLARDTVNITVCMIAAGSGVAQHNRTYTLARPKSMILILFVTLLTQRMFSG